MRRSTAVGLGVLWLLSGCAAAPQSSPADPPATGTTPAPAQAATGPSFLSIIGTPFLVAFKIPVCIATVAVAAPLAGLSEIPTTADTEGSDMRRQLEYGVNSNCGPPWVVSP